MGTFAEMTDIIRLLPDAVANQIAAGEVVQRPASAVKELLENTIDAGATDIKLIIKESGKMLIQVTDNGCGMSERDARMCFERHATSKIQKADDLLAIRTLGFRGEALASIASIAQVELKTKRHEDEVGTSILIEGTEFKGQSPVNCQNGTTISVKNLFFNVPARRNFLKSNTLELKYIIEEFFRVAMVNPDLAFTFYNQDKILFQLPAANLKQRIINLYGPSYTQRLIPVEQQTDLVNISGFIGKPEFAKKTRGEQYFFTNGRFIKSSYLHHAVDSAFKELIPDDSIPSYFIFMEVDPQTIDVNIHPTKTEINFQDIKSIYAILHAAVKQAIGKFSLSPTLDFETEQSMNFPPLPDNHPIRQPVITVNPNYNPFEKKIQPQTSFSFPQKPPPSIQGWRELYNTTPAQGEIIDFPSARTGNFGESGADSSETTNRKRGVQVQNSFIVTNTQSGVIIIDQQHAHERVLYERFLEANLAETNPGQHQLIPQTITLSPDDAQFFQEWESHFRKLGFEIDDFGKGSFVIHAIPAHLETSDISTFIESVLESLKSPGQEQKNDQSQVLAKAMAKKLSIKRGKKLYQEEMDSLVENLFACKVPGISPDGKPTMLVISYDELNTKFKI
ncbi:MAG: DNA mismatch repair endonuclease MutL [Bacteroidetes bacterium]|nr:DNA mismatch repair endonuclease MutL [Bacteroidota bacterium]